ncbi:MAG: hypothetical protein HY695_12250 [Deltaproteobacteria bacterium]|nr:hypothetical protein [Deltaproteobacteria bacterium]
MKKVFTLVFVVVFYFGTLVSQVGSQLQPVGSATLFGGAERGSDDHAGGIGGIELLGLLPLGSRWGLQGSILNQGGAGGYRLGLSAGPVYAYNSGKFGLFGDYVHQNRGDNNFFYARGVWSHYFDNFDLVLSYSHPLNSVQHTRRTVTDQTISPENNCDPNNPVLTKRGVRKSVPAINELKGVIRYYPNPRVELNAGLLVNSFAGPDRNKTGTGFGGVFGVAFQVLDWLIVRPLQAQMDTRERYRITSGVELVWAPLQQYQRGHAEAKDTSFAAAGGAAGVSSIDPRCLETGGDLEIPT